MIRIQSSAVVLLTALAAVCMGCQATEVTSPSPTVAPSPSPLVTPAVSPSPPPASPADSALPAPGETAASETAIPPAALPPSPTRPTFPSLQQGDVITRAVSALAQLLEVEAQTIEVVAVRSDEFPAQNLGCPSGAAGEEGPVQPAFVTGKIIILNASGVEYEYRAHGGLIVFCGQR